MRRYESMSDDQLVHLYSAGTNEAFDTLLLRYDALCTYDDPLLGH